MPKSTDRQEKRKKDALLSAGGSIAFRLILVPLFLLLYRATDDTLARYLLLAVTLLNLGMIVPVVITLKTRLKEIDGGEEDAAAQY